LSAASGSPAAKARAAAAINESMKIPTQLSLSPRSGSALGSASSSNRREWRQSGGTRTMATSSATRNGSTPDRRVSAAGWLALAAAPTFAVMACLTATGGPPAALCSAMSGPLSVHGMAAMYLLMSLFHLPPWLKLAFQRPRGVYMTTTKGNL